VQGLTLYKFFDVGPNASINEIQAAYRKLSKSYHPDGGGSAELFRELRDAYSTLCDPIQRAEYDRRLNPPDLEPTTISTSSRTTAPVRNPEMVDVTCTSCAKRQTVFTSTRRFVCVSCHVAWRFAQCSNCKKASHVRETSLSWRCPHCTTVTQSRWSVSEQFSCVICTTKFTYPRGVKRFACLRCSSRYSECPKCETYVIVTAEPHKKSMKCPHCRKRLAR
jgi:DnaJ-class molecular chaperone